MIMLFFFILHGLTIKSASLGASVNESKLAMVLKIILSLQILHLQNEQFAIFTLLGDRQC